MKIGLALSGGGFRATLFHIGSLTRLNELGYLPQLSELSSVSGGSITSAFLGLKWNDLNFDPQTNVASNFEDVVTRPLQSFCSRTIDVGAIVGGLISPFRHPGKLIENAYRKHLFGDAMISELPDGTANRPRFTIYATSLQTGSSVTISSDELGDWKIGVYPSPPISVAKAVAASSAFPPPLCPVPVNLPPEGWKDSFNAPLHTKTSFRSQMQLGDGGIYDNLGLERILRRCDQVLVSDAGAPFEPDSSPTLVRYSQLARTKRVLDIVTSQTRALRIRDLMGRYKSKEKSGTYWGIGSKVSNYYLENEGDEPIILDSSITDSLATLRTRLNKFTHLEQGRLINWGYALCDTSMRKHVILDPVATGLLPVSPISMG